MTVGRQIVRALEVFKYGENDDERHERMLQLLDLVKLPVHLQPECLANFQEVKSSGLE